MTKISIAIIGCGHWGPNFIRNFSKIKGVTVKYVCDLSLQRLLEIKKVYPGIIITHELNKILNDKEVIAVVIVTPAQTHYKLAKQSLLSGKHVLVEKPITNNIAHAEELIAIAKKSKRILMVGHTFKYNQGINRLKDFIDRKKLGDIFYIHSQRTNLGPLRKDVNAMWDLVPHDISVANYFLNMLPVSVSAKGGKFLAHDLEDVVFINLTYPNRILVNIHASWLDPRKVRQITVVGNKKMAVFDDLNIHEPLRIYDKSVIKKSFKQDYRSFREFRMIIKEGEAFVPKITFSEPLMNEVVHFINCIKKDLKPLTDGFDGLSVVKIMVALEKSLNNNGREVKLSEV